MFRWQMPIPVLGVQMTVETTSCVGADVHKYLLKNLVVPNPLPCPVVLLRDSAWHHQDSLA